MSGNEANGGIVSIEDGVADSSLGVENEYSDVVPGHWNLDI